MQPAIALDLGLELARRPAGIAERENGVLGAGTVGDRTQDVDGGGEADAVVDPQRRIFDIEVAGMQHEAAAGIDRAAAQNFHAFGILRQPDVLALLDDAELLQQLGKVDAAGRMVDDDAHRALGGMGTEIDHRALEAGIAHDGHRDQQPAVEITGRIRESGARPAGAFARPLACGSHR